MSDCGASAAASAAIIAEDDDGETIFDIDFGSEPTYHSTKRKRAGRIIIITILFLLVMALVI